MGTRLLTWTAVLAFAGLCACGDDAIIVNDDGISSGGVKLEAINPERGSILGGNNVLLEGSGLGGNNVVVAFGDVAANDVVVLSAEALLVVAPPGVDPGAVDIVVANAQGFAQRNVAYVYNDRPVIASVSPSSGARVGGDVVTISGTGFQEFEAGDNAVTFDGEPADGVEVISDTELSVVSPPGMPRSNADIQVANTNGAAEMPDAYLYLANGLFASVHNPVGPNCSGSNPRVPTLLFIDLDDASVFDIGTDRLAGFSRITTDTEGGLVGLEACTHDLYQIDPETGASTLLVDTNYDFSGRRLAGMIRDGNAYIVSDPATGSGSGAARLSLSSGEITAVGAGGGSGGSRRNAFARDGNRVFVIGQTSQGNGFVELDITTGNEIGTPIVVPFSNLRGGTIHRGDLFITQRISFGKGGQEFASRLMVVDRSDGDSNFVGVVPAYLSSLTSGDL